MELLIEAGIFDKLLALGFHTGYDQAGNLDRFGDAAWINGGSPTEGFLAFGADGPFKGFYNSIAGAQFFRNNRAEKSLVVP